MTTTIPLVSAPARRSRSRARRGRPVGLEQLALTLDHAPPSWDLSRYVVRSPHRARILERLELVRGFYPELSGCTVRVGIARKRGILGWGSLDPERPGVWVRPRRLDLFTIAHEFTHLLQARGLVPRGERACDLWALARSALLVDVPPSYLDIPRALRKRRLGPDDAALLHRLAREALAARARGERRHIAGFERALAEAVAASRPRTHLAGRTAP